MKKAIILTVFALLGSILIVELARYSSRSTAIFFEWVAVISCALFIVLSSWAGSKYLYKRRAQKEQFLVKPSSEIAVEYGISKRELEVLELLAEGLSNRQISEKLFVSESTIKKHVSNIFVKLNADRRTDAVRIAYQSNLISNSNFAKAD